MCKTLKIILAAFVSVFPVLSAKAQDNAYSIFSPYSMFGIGDISKQGTVYNRSMGGIGIAARDSRALNIMNPAAVTKRETKAVMVDFGLFSENKYYKQHDIESSNNTINMYNIIMSFPVYKSFAMYAGFTPFSNIGYDITSYASNPAIIASTGGITYQAIGSGGMNNAFIGGGVDIFKGFSAGAEIGYIFGKINKDNLVDYRKTDIRDVYSGYEMRLHTFTGKFGAQYEMQLKNSMTATFGATYRFKTRMRGSVNDVRYTSIASIVDTITSSQNHLSKDDGVKLAGEIGIGFSLKQGDKWTAEINYIRSDWSNCGMNVSGFANVGDAKFSAAASQSIRAGFSLVPNRNDIRYYMKRVTYRAGTYWDREYYKLDGNTIDAFGLTFGATFPVFRWSNGLSVGMDIGQRGSLSGNKVRERYINFTVGLNIFDIWFLKPQYD
ncbi:MAG: hypothetical protein PUK70_08500 [Bacteroidales bacterium]|nr:hypothetical protein [Bacteroidales bacterium]MDY6001087.1 hypothetical protein [Candidatus Cryptobacteroides sp.]